MPKASKEMLESRIIIDPAKLEELLKLANKSARDLSRELGRSEYYLNGIKNRSKRDMQNGCYSDSPNSRNSLTKLEYQYLSNKYDFDFKLEKPVEEVEKPDHGRYKMENLNREDIPDDQRDIYIAVYFGVYDALKDFHREFIFHKDEEAKG